MTSRYHSEYLPSSSVVALYGPTSDITLGAWTPSTGSNLFSMINELVVDDTDYDSSSRNPINDTMEIAFGAVASNSVAGITIRYKIGAENFTSDLTVGLYSGATLIKLWTHTGMLAGVLTMFVQTLSAAEEASITDRNDLRLRFVAN